MSLLAVISDGDIQRFTNLISRLSFVIVLFLPGIFFLMCSLQVFSPSIFSPLILSQFLGLFGEAKKGGWKQVSLMSLHNCPPKKSWKLLEKLIGTPGVFWGEGKIRGGGVWSNANRNEDSEPRYEDMVGYLRVWELWTLGFWFFFGWVHKCHGFAKWMVVSSLDMSEPSQLRLVGWLVVSDFPNSTWKLEVVQ